MVPEPVTVRLVEVDVDHGRLKPASVHVPDPIAIVLVPVFALSNADEAPDSVKLKPFASNVPELKTKAVPVLLEETNAS